MITGTETKIQSDVRQATYRVKTKESEHSRELCMLKQKSLSVQLKSFENQLRIQPDGVVSK